nr:multidrug efflux SMR transporter [Kineosporia babensis]
MALAGAIVLEVIATVSLKTADGFTRFWPSVIVVVGYVGCFSLLGFALKTFDVGLVYAIWSAVGTAAITIVGIMLFGESITLPRACGVLLIVLGVIVLNLSGGEAHAAGGPASQKPATQRPATQKPATQKPVGQKPNAQNKTAFIPNQRARVQNRPVRIHNRGAHIRNPVADIRNQPIEFSIGPDATITSSAFVGAISLDRVKLTRPDAPPNLGKAPQEAESESGEAPMLTPRTGLVPRQARPRHDMSTDPDSDLGPIFPDLRRKET